MHAIPDRYAMRREDAVRAVAAHLRESDIIVATTGKTSRELFEYRAATDQRHAGDFLTVGSMGHASQVAMAIAQSCPDRQVVCLDGDGAAIMHLGSLAIIGTRAPGNFKHVIINNGAHDSVGGQPTAGHTIDLPAIASACRYRYTMQVENEADLPAAVKRLRNLDGPVLLEILTSKGARNDLGRPTITPIENKKSFMRNFGS
jgi:phosphonopyruvate decarboxylase